MRARLLTEHKKKRTSKTLQKEGLYGDREMMIQNKDSGTLTSNNEKRKKKRKRKQMNK